MAALKGTVGYEPGIDRMVEDGPESPVVTMTNPYAPQESEGDASPASLAGQVLSRHGSESGIVGLVMSFLCGGVSLLHFGTSVLFLTHVLDQSQPMMEVVAIACGAVCFVSSVLAWSAAGFWWRESYRWALRLSAFPVLVSMIILGALT